MYFTRCARSHAASRCTGQESVYHHHLRRRPAFNTCTSFLSGLVFLVTLSFTYTPTFAESVWVMRNADMTIHLNQDVLASHGLTVQSLTRRSLRKNEASIEVTIANNDDIAFLADRDSVNEWYASTLSIAEGLRFVSRSGSQTVYDFNIAFDEFNPYSLLNADSTSSSDPSSPALELHGFRVGFNASQSSIILPGESIRISASLASALGDPHLAGLSIGWAVTRGVTVLERGSDSNLEILRPVTHEEGQIAGRSGDMTFCELYGLRQFGRSGSTVGLAMTTTSWNVGSADLQWFAIPNSNHPVIAMNMYRLEDDRFQQIGQSWLKHGFFALDSEQCGTPCRYEPGHAAGNWLGKGCTDTYTAGLNASQSNLGPRYEVNPWTGAWSFSGSHLSVFHSHAPAEHQLQVVDNDVDPAQHAVATFYAEGYYIVGDDGNHMNNASWKPITVSGSPGSTWNFGMSNFSIRPETGFAIDAWSDARKTVIAQEVPPVEFISPDGRCVLAVKTKKINLKLWHYEYALLNVDMHRKVKSFSIPLSVDTSASNIGFSAVRSHDEPFNNVPWTPSVSTGAITWSTVNNPIRWGTLYNFWFDADTPPTDTTVTLELFEPGTVTSVAGITTGPNPTGPDCLILSPATADITQINKNRYISFTPGNAMQSAAIRVRLTSLMQPANPAGNEPDYSLFEGQLRWVGEPISYPEATEGEPSFTAAKLQCEPFFRDWGDIDILYVYGDDIVPSSMYDIQLIHESCINANNESQYTEILSIPTAKWGDIVTPFIHDPNITFQPDITDVLAVVDKFLGVLNPIKARSQVQPNIPDPTLGVGIADILNVVDAWLGTSYPFAGPSSCPK